MRAIGGIDRMVDCKDNWQVRGCSLQLGDKPRSLGVADLPALRTVAIQSDNRDKRRIQSPKDVWLRHGSAWSLAVVRADHRRLGAEITDECLQARFACAGIHVAIVFAGDRNYRSVRVKVRFVDLRPGVRTL